MTHVSNTQQKGRNYQRFFSSYFWQNYILSENRKCSSSTPCSVKHSFNSWQYFSNISTIHFPGKIMKHLALFVALLHIFLVCLLTDVFWQCLFWSFVDPFAENCRFWCKSSSARTQQRISPFFTQLVVPYCSTLTLLSRSGNLSCHREASHQSFSLIVKKPREAECLESKFWT